MNIVSRTITGGVMMAGGIALLVLALFNGLGEGYVVALIHGLVILVIGIVIFFNKREDSIEKIKSQGRKK